jgi:hypothetical protein
MRDKCWNYFSTVAIFHLVDRIHDGSEAYYISNSCGFISFSLEPEVCDVDAWVKLHPIVPLCIVDEVIQQLAHPGSTADVHVAGVAELHRMPQRLFVTGIKGIL